jgi:quaternary ammonium compound-resistance protein SugE
MFTASDVIILGAGMAGASLAAELAPHRKVVLVEIEDQPGRHATGRSAAMFFESYGNATVRALTRASRAFLERPRAGFAAAPLLSPRSALFLGDTQRLAALRAMLDAPDAPATLRALLAEAAMGLCPILRLAGGQLRPRRRSLLLAGRARLLWHPDGPFAGTHCGSPGAGPAAAGRPPGKACMCRTLGRRDPAPRESAVTAMIPVEVKAWLLLLIAGLLETVWALSMKASEGFTRLPYTVLTFVAAWASFWLLGLALRSLPVGTAYAVWTGIGAVGVAVAGMVLFAEPATAARIVCIALIAAGILGLKLVTP